MNLNLIYGEVVLSSYMWREVLQGFSGDVTGIIAPFPYHCNHAILCIIQHLTLKRDPPSCLTSLFLVH